MHDPSKEGYERFKGYEFWVRVNPDVKAGLSQSSVKCAIERFACKASEDMLEPFGATYRIRVAGRNLTGVARIEYGENGEEIGLLDVELTKEPATAKEG